MIIDKIGGLAFSKLSFFLETNQLICDNTHQEVTVATMVVSGTMFLYEGDCCD